MYDLDDGGYMASLQAVTNRFTVANNSNLRNKAANRKKKKEKKAWRQDSHKVQEIDRNIHSRNEKRNYKQQQTANHLRLQILQITKKDPELHACPTSLGMAMGCRTFGPQHIVSYYICRIRVVMKDQNSILFRERVSHAQHCAAA